SNTTFANVDQVLDGLERTTGQLATSIRFPPLDVASLRKEWNALKQAVRSIPPRSVPSPQVVRSQWEELKGQAEAHERSVFELSSLLALSTVRAVPENLIWLSRCAGSATRRTGQLFASGLLDHYRDTLAAIRSEGYLAYWTREF